MRLDKGQIEIVDDIMAEVLRHRTPAERIGIGFDMWVSVHNMLISHLKSSHSDWSIEKVRQEVARRLSHGPL